jgi:hypothetical protein
MLTVTAAELTDHFESSPSGFVFGVPIDLRGDLPRLIIPVARSTLPVLLLSIALIIPVPAKILFSMYAPFLGALLLVKGRPMTTNDDAFEKALPQLLPMIKVAFDAGRELGFAEGLEAGKAIGFVAGVNALTPAVSDGLRSGSSACGKVMQSLKNLGLNIDNEQDSDDNQETD